MYLCCDLSLKCSGWAKFTNDGRLVKRGRIVPDTEINNCSKIHFIAVKIRGLLTGVDEVIIEDTYSGKNPVSVKWLDRLGGAVITEWIDHKYKEPIFYKATTARKLAGINGHSHKSEIQVFILEKYKFAPKKKIQEYQDKIDRIKEQLKSKEIKRGSYKYQLNKLSNLILKETEYGENICDAILLGIAYQEDTTK